MTEDNLNTVGRIVVEQSAAEALGMGVDEVRALTLRQFIERATERGLDVDVSMNASRHREGHLSVTYKPDRRSLFERSR